MPMYPMGVRRSLLGCGFALLSSRGHCCPTAQPFLLILAKPPLE